MYLNYKLYLLNSKLDTPPLSRSMGNFNQNLLYYKNYNHITHEKIHKYE